MLSRKTKYGLKALLVLAEGRPGEPLVIAELSRQAKAPRKFLEAILLAMKARGLVVSRQGKAGGYSLARRPEQITLGEVIRLLEGPLALVPCASLTAYQRCDDCLEEQSCGLRLVMKDVRDATAHILDSTTLANVLERIRSHVREDDGLVDFQI